MPYTRPPLKIGLSPRFLHQSPPELGFRGKALQYLEPSVAHWVMSGDALIFMIPSTETGALIRRSKLSSADYADALDGLVLQGGADVSPRSYGEAPLHDGSAAALAAAVFFDDHVGNLVDAFVRGESSFATQALPPTANSIAFS